MRVGEDPLFNSLHDNPRFAELVAYSKQHAAAQNAK
jgi:hypothetical protein